MLNHHSPSITPSSTPYAQDCKVHYREFKGEKEKNEPMPQIFEENPRIGKKKISRAKNLGEL